MLHSISIMAQIKLTSLPEVMKATSFIVTDQYIYVAEPYRVHIYSLDFKHIKSFGKKGEGPEEFNAFFKIQINFLNDKLYVNCRRKFLVYNPDGEFLKEFRMKFSEFGIMPINKGYFGNQVNIDRKTGKKTLKIILLDNEKVEKKVFYKNESKINLDLTRPYIIKYQDPIIGYIGPKHFIIYKPGKDFSLMLYHHSGQLNRILTIPYKKITIPQSYKNAFIANRKKPLKGRLMSYYNELMKNATFRFPPHFSPCRTVKADKYYIYVFRDIPDFSKYGIWIINYQGEILKRTKIPRNRIGWLHRGIYYSVIENEDSEEWELWSKKLFP